MNSNLLIGAVVAAGIGLIVMYSFSGDKDSVVSDEGATKSTIQNEVSIPANMPANIPMYPGAELTKVQDIPSEDARDITLTLETSDSVADVNTWYRGALSQNSWAVTSDKNVGGYILLKGVNENVSIFTQAARRSDEGGAVITQRIQIKQ